MTERVFPGRLFDIGGGRILPSPNQFYLTGEDTLRVVSANALAGVTIKVQCRTANPQGDTVGHSYDHVPTSDRMSRTEDFAIGDGSLLNVTAFVNTGAPIVGQTYVAVQIVRGRGAAAVVLGTILGGYVTRRQAIGFPGSPIRTSTDGEPAIRTISGTTPAAGAEIIETVPTGARWELLALLAFLTTGPAATNRLPRLYFFNAGGGFALSLQVGTVAASSSADVAWAAGLTSIAPATANALQAPLPQPLPLLEAQTFQTFTLNLAAPDQYACVRYTVREWLEVNV
jgi:hypothetical protein